MRHSRVAIVAVVVFAALVGTAARKGASRSGSIKDNVFTDATYHYQLTLSDDWKTNLFDADCRKRLLLTHKTLKKPLRINGWNYLGTDLPVKIEFWVVSDSLMSKGLVDSLVSEKYESPLKDTILASAEGLWQTSGFVRTQGGRRRMTKFGARDGVIWRGSFVYKTTSVSQVELGIGLLNTHCEKYELLGLIYCDPKLVDSAVVVCSSVMQSLKTE
jgi:hypothetical protein